MPNEISTPRITPKGAMDDIAENAGFQRDESTPRRNAVILALPGVSEEEARKFTNTLQSLAPYLPFNLAITYNRVAALTKEDILEWKEKIDHICKANGWAK